MLVYIKAPGLLFGCDITMRYRQFDRVVWRQLDDIPEGLMVRVPEQFVIHREFNQSINQPVSLSL